MNQHSSMCSLTEILNYGWLFLILLLLEKSSAADYWYEACAPRTCGKLNISFPFYIQGVQEQFCGKADFGINCSDSSSPIIHVPENDYVIDNIFYQDQTLRVHNVAVSSINNCLPQIGNITENRPLSVAENSGLSVAENSSLLLLSNCTEKLPGVLQKYRKNLCHAEDEEGWGLAMLGDDQNLNIAFEVCTRNVLVPVGGEGNVGENGVVDYNGLLRRGFVLNWTASDCSRCLRSGGRCGLNTTSLLVMCFCPDRPHFVSCKPRKKNLGVILGSAIGGVACIFLALAILLIWRRKKRINGFPYFLSRRSSKLDLEDRNAYFGVSVFSYSELQEATKNFDASKELGDGGFGTVYHGKLRDGREVAVKRLYEHNFKRMEQFMNEIEILTRLRHRNLVTLYGCTSRRSRELLLVYEYIPNGTVADHLHGHTAKDKYLTWEHRMNIAIETAEALAYLHASDIIHRDVKTDNILLDHNFCVKVADFGLSRLFPSDVTHISTAPQGTPGYVDPEYHQCYHLTDKSDVYSFGVVLIELISSMPAVDITRHRHEINLANLAINRIQRSAFDELIDTALGHKSDAEVMRMTTSVAELAFQCLQGEKEMRPTMVQVLETLKEIQNFKEISNENTNDESDKFSETKSNPRVTFSPEPEDRVLLTNVKFPSSPTSVTNVWVSSSTSASTSSRDTYSLSLPCK